MTSKIYEEYMYEDTVKRPNHYQSHPSGIGPIEITKHESFLRGNIIKYVSRWKSKNGIADLEKAKHCIELLIDLERQHGHQ